MQEVAVVGLALAIVFQVHGIDAAGVVVVRASGCGAARFLLSSRACRLVWSGMRPVRQPIIGAGS